MTLITVTVGCSFELYASAMIDGPNFIGLRVVGIAKNETGLNFQAGLAAALTFHQNEIRSQTFLMADEPKTFGLNTMLRHAA